tara:strand:- start:193 stop:906 length:714 start_codon:yes stop_codon:yes gene_type:complete
MNIVALLTGRGNNTLANKNILPVLNRPLLAYPCDAAKNVNTINYHYASSDDDNILEAASREGYKKIKRPIEISTSTSQHIDAIFHAIDYLKEEENIFPDILVVLLANSVTIKTKWISQSINFLLEDPSLSSVVPVYQEQSHHPYRAKRANKEGLLEPFFNFGNEDISTNRQDLEDCYFLCHNFWTLNVKNSLYSNQGQQPWTFLGDKIKYIKVDKGFDVHSQEDIKKSEEWLIKEKQ